MDFRGRERSTRPLRAPTAASIRLGRKVSVSHGEPMQLCILAAAVGNAKL